jgi:hypothetical protein
MEGPLSRMLILSRSVNKHDCHGQLFGKAVSEKKNFKKLTNQKKELPVAAMFVNVSGRNVQSL